MLTYDNAHCLCSGRLLVGTFVALFFNLLTLMSVRNKPFAYVSEGTVNPVVCFVLFFLKRDGFSDFCVFWVSPVIW